MSPCTASFWPRAHAACTIGDVLHAMPSHRHQTPFCRPLRVARQMSSACNMLLVLVEGDKNNIEPCKTQSDSGSAQTTAKSRPCRCRLPNAHNLARQPACAFPKKANLIWGTPHIEDLAHNVELAKPAGRQTSHTSVKSHTSRKVARSAKML